MSVRAYKTQPSPTQPLIFLETALYIQRWLEMESKMEIASRDHRVMSPRPNQMSWNKSGATTRASFWFCWLKRLDRLWMLLFVSCSREDMECILSKSSLLVWVSQPCSARYTCGTEKYLISRLEHRLSEDGWFCEHSLDSLDCSVYIVRNIMSPQTCSSEGLYKWW